MAKKAFDSEPVYADTKQANLLFATELKKRHGDWLTVRTAHPGVCSTELFRHNWYYTMFKMFFQTPAAGAMLELRAATDMELPAGTYVGTGNAFKGAPIVEEPAPKCVDPQTAENLWKASETAVAFSY